MSPLDTSSPPPPALDGEAAPLADAYLRHHAWLTKVLTRRYGADGDDIAQDTWLRIRRYVPPGPVRHPKSLLMRIALSLASNRLRKTGRETPTDPHHDVLADRTGDSTQDEALFFEQMMLALPPKLRDVFVLNHVRGLTYREIAQLRGISVKAVEKRMTLAIARCAEMMRG